MACNVLVEYPSALRAAVGNSLSSYEPHMLVEKYGLYLLVACRFSKIIIFKIAPTSIIASYQVCRRSLVLADPADLHSYGTLFNVKAFTDIFGNLKEEIIVCAPPLDGPYALDLATMAWKESDLLETALDAIMSIENLDVLFGWTSERAKSATRELFTRLKDEAYRWWTAASVQPSDSCVIADSCVTRNRGKYLRYGISSLKDDLALSIIKLTGADLHKRLSRRNLPDMNFNLVGGLIKIASHCLFNKDTELAFDMYRALMNCPETILSVLHPSYYKDIISIKRTRYLSTALKRICIDETSSVVTCKKFVICQRIAYDLAKRVANSVADICLHPPDVARDNLDKFLGGYLGDLDLSQSYITGSAATSSSLRHQLDIYLDEHISFLGSYFPSVFSKVTPRDAQALLSMDKLIWEKGTPPPFTFTDVAAPQNVSAPSDDGSLRTFKEMRWRWQPKNVVVPFEVIPGVGVDIVIDATDCEFDLIARSHYEVIKRRFPSAILVSADNHSGYRVVSSKAPGLEKGFRVVEMYRSSWADICKSSVGITRLAYTAARLDGVESRQAEFYMTASCLQAAIQRSTLDYHHRESQKSLPQEVLLKYAMRGYPPKFLSKSLEDAIHYYVNKTPRWNPSGGNQYWGDLKSLFPSRNCLGDFNLANYEVERDVYGYGKW